MADITVIHDADIERRETGWTTTPGDRDTAFRDTYMQETSPATKYGEVNWIKAGLGGKDAALYILCYFDLTKYLPADVLYGDIVSAVWHFRVVAGDTDPDHDFYLLRTDYATFPWTELDCSWNKYDGTNNWTTAGRQGETTPSYLTIPGPVATGWHTLDVKTMVVDALQNRSGICAWVLRRDLVGTESGEIWLFAKEEYDDGTGPPEPTSSPHHLRITYTLNGKTFQTLIH